MLGNISSVLDIGDARRAGGLQRGEKVTVTWLKSPRSLSKECSLEGSEFCVQLQRGLGCEGEVEGTNAI